MKLLKYQVSSLYGKHVINYDGLKVNSANAKKRRLLTNIYPWREVFGVTLLTIIIFILVFLLHIEFQEMLNINSQKTMKVEDNNELVISCYYNMPNENRSSSQLLPADIHPRLCTHINVAFASVVDRQIFLDDSQLATLKEVVQLKNKNPNLKVLLSVGGAGENNGFSQMVANHTSRKYFIKSIKSVLRNYSLDGVDLDWEFPAFHYTDVQLGARERQHFSQLLREIRMEYFREKRDYLLTVAVAAPQTIVDVSYDVDQINLYVDYVNLMTYDFHYFTKFTPFTGFNSPLFARASEELYLATLNINYTIHMYQQKGLNPNKMVVGIPTYGHTFKLVNPENPGVGSPAAGFGNLGGLGFVDYPVICLFNSSNAHVTVEYDEQAKVPYLYSGTEWVSYESERSVAEKADYIKQQGLRGAMLYSLNADDYDGRCGANVPPRFPLSSTVHRVLTRS